MAEKIESNYYDELTEQFAKRFVDYGVSEIVAKNILQQFTFTLKRTDEEMIEQALCDSQVNVSIVRHDNKTELTHGNGAFHIRTAGKQNKSNNYGIISTHGKFPEALKVFIS